MKYRFTLWHFAMNDPVVRCQIEKISYLLGFPLVWALVLVINAREIRHNDGDGKGDDQDSGQGANATDHFAYCRARHHVTISEILIKIE